MLFTDRQQAGQLLANLLKAYQNNPEVIVIGLPRGGVILAHTIAQTLQAPLDIICARKIGAPYNLEFAIGAITENGDFFLDQETIERLGITADYLDKETHKQTQEAARRVAVYKGKRPFLDLHEKTVILVDDGIATGATMKAAIKTTKSRGAKKIIVAVPVASPTTLQEIEQEVNDILYLAAPTYFMAVGQFYEQFNQTTDEEVIALLSQGVY